MNRANEELCDHNPENLFVTAFTVNMDPATGTVVYANAGHTYPVLIKAKKDGSMSKFELHYPKYGIFKFWVIGKEDEVYEIDFGR